MAKKSLSDLIRQIEWKSAGKVIGSGLLLFFAWIADLSFGVGVLFALWLWFIYVTELQERKSLAALYWVSGILGYTTLARFSGADESLGGALSVVFGYMAFLAVVLGISRFFFRERIRIYHILQSVLIAALFLLFFSGPLSWRIVLFLGISLVFLFREFFVFERVPWRGRVLLAAVVLAFLGVEIAIFSRFLPLGFVNAAVFVSLFLVLTRDAAKAHFTGMLHLPFVLRSIAIFLFISSLIFSIAPWVI